MICSVAAVFILTESLIMLGAAVLIIIIIIFHKDVRVCFQSFSLLNCRICSVASLGCPPRGAGRCFFFLSLFGWVFIMPLKLYYLCPYFYYYFFFLVLNFMINLPQKTLLFQMYLVDICIYYHFKKDKRTEADRSVCLI